MIEIETKNGSILLDKGQAFGLTSAVSDFGKIETRQGITSNSFDVPRTASNMQKLGFSDILQSNSSINPYSQVKCKIKKNGNFIAKGFLQITGFNDKVLTIEFFGGNTEWYKELGNIKINEIEELQEYIHIWNSENIVLYSEPSVSNRAFFYPILSNNKQVSRSEFIFYDKELYPAFFIKKIIELVFNNNGYSLGGDFYESSFFERLFLPYSNSGEPVASQSEINKRKYIEKKLIKYVETFPGGTTYTRTIPLFLFSGNIKQIGDFNGVGYFCYYDSYNFFFPFFELFFTDGVEEPIVFLQIKISTSIGDFTLPFNGILSLSGLRGATILGFELIYNILLLGSLSTTNITYTGVDIYPNFTTGDIFNNYVNPAWFLPSISFSDLLKSLANQFGLFFFTDFINNKVYIYSLQNTIKNKKQSLDYTHKINFEGNEIDFTKIVENYYQTYFFNYKETTDDFLIAQYNESFGFIKDFGQGVFNIKNDFIEKKGVIFTSVFAPTICGNVFDSTTYLSIIPNFDDLGNATNPNPRILILGEKIPFSQISTASSYSIQGEGSFADLYFCYFTKKDVAKNDYQNLTFGKLADGTEYGFSLQDTYLKDLTRILQKPFVLKAKFLISEADFQNFDFSKLIYLGVPYYSYFFVNRIVEYGNDNLTELELIKV